MQLTPNLGLKKPDYVDDADIMDMNDNMTVLDNAVGDLQSNSFKNIPSYLMWVTNANTNSLDSAFGKLNEDLVSQIGNQLAMYAWFKGASKITYPLTNLKLQDTLLQCLTNGDSLSEIFNENLYILPLIYSSPYALGVFNANVETMGGYSLAKTAGLANYATYTTVASLYAVEADMILVLQNQACSKVIMGNSTLQTQLLLSATATSALTKSDRGLNELVKLSAAKTTLLSNLTLFDSNYSNMATTLASSALFTATSGNGNHSTNVTQSIGTATSFVNCLIWSDNISNTPSPINFSNLRHTHNALEVVHPTFPTGNAIGNTTVNKFAVGGATSITGSPTSAGMSFTATIYTAI